MGVDVQDGVCLYACADDILIEVVRGSTRHAFAVGATHRNTTQKNWFG